AAAPDRGVDGVDPGPAPDAHAVQLLPDEGRRLLARGLAGDDLDAVAPAQAFQAGRQVDRVADDRVAAAHAGAHVADAHEAGVQPDAHAHARQATAQDAIVDLAHGGRHVDGGVHGALGMVGQVHRRAPERHDAVAHVLVHRAVVRVD